MIIKKINKKKIIIIFSTVLLLFLITILLVRNNQNKKEQQYIQQEQQRVKQYTSIQSFQNLEEVALYLNSKFIKQEKSNIENIEFNIYMELSEKVQDGEKLNKDFYNKLIQYTAYVLKYKNFAIIDENNKTTIFVICEENEQLVAKYSVNGIENYFEVKESEKNAKQITQVEPIKIQVTSNILKQLMNNNWSTNSISLGTKESTYRGYDIYFDEGIEVKYANKKVFNIIFTEKYNENVINNINTKTSKEEIQKTLGKPQFESGNLFGYKTENMYVFFYKNQVSIYRIEEFNTEEIAKVIEKYVDNKDMQQLVNGLKEHWKDYDIYENNDKELQLQYSLKGLSVQFNDLNKRGIILYNNYEGKVLRKCRV